MTRAHPFIVLGIAAALILSPTNGYLLYRSHPSTLRHGLNFRALQLARYGPPTTSPDDDATSSQESQRDYGVWTLQQTRDFGSLIRQAITLSDPQMIPSLLTRNIDLILSIVLVELPETTSTEQMVETLVLDSILENESANEEQRHTAKSISSDLTDMILSCVEEFVEQAHRIDDSNKRFLGKIIQTMANKDRTARQREEDLDELLRNDRDKLCAGFLRHIQGECERIENAPKMTRESARLLEMMRMIQTRVLEELGQDLGEAAQVLGQLIAYDNKSERLAVLDAGLAVRGLAFANELMDLTEEALEGFSRVPDGAADPDLVECVKSIQGRVKRYVAP